MLRGPVHVPGICCNDMSPRVSWYVYNCATPILGWYCPRDVPQEVVAGTKSPQISVCTIINVTANTRGHVAATYPWDMYPQHFHVCAHVVILQHIYGLGKIMFGIDPLRYFLPTVSNILFQEYLNILIWRVTNGSWWRKWLNLSLGYHASIGNLYHKLGQTWTLLQRLSASQV